LYLYYADFRVTNQGVNLPVYQRVNTSTDYDSTGFPVYIKPNGSNQFMQTNSINFTATDKMTVWQGVRKLSNGNIGVVLETSIDSGSNAGSFAFFDKSGSANTDILFRAGGSAFAQVIPTNFAAPLTFVLTAQASISSPELLLRSNAVQVAATTTTQGGGNFGNYPAYFYSRAGTVVFFNGNDYGSIARGAASTAAQIANGEAYINKLTKAFT
jgi:hypothetical protein